MVNTMKKNRFSLPTTLDWGLMKKYEFVATMFLSIPHHGSSLQLLHT
jgi:hypothetical protein